MLAHRTLKLVASRHQIGERGGQFGEDLLGCRERAFGAGDARRDFRLALRDVRAVLRQSRLFVREARERGVGVGLKPLLALDVLRKLHQPAVKLGDPFGDARFFLIELLARHHQALQGSAGLRLFVAQWRQVGGGVRLPRRGFGLRADRVRHVPDSHVLRVNGLGGFRVGGDPAQVEQRRLGLAHVGRDLLVAHRLTRLTLQAVHLLGKLADHVLEPREVRLGRLQP